MTVAEEEFLGLFSTQWYDLQQSEWPQLPQARRDLHQRLEQLVTTVPLANTVLLGFSQGGAMAIDVATSAASTGLPLAALVSCSGYPHPGWQPGPLHTPVLLTHGEQDPVVPFAASVAVSRVVLGLHYPTDVLAGGLLGWLLAGGSLALFAA